MSTAKKNDSGKPQLSLIPREALIDMAKGFGYGAEKYGRFNFEQGHKYSRLLDAALRHLTAMAAGEFIDAESGNTHLSHALCSLAMLSFNCANHPENDDLTRVSKQAEAEASLQEKFNLMMRDLSAPDKNGNVPVPYPAVPSVGISMGPTYSGNTVTLADYPQKEAKHDNR